MNNVCEFIPTRHSLLSRLKHGTDEESWKVFFDTYWKLIYNAARKAGLTDPEAQDVVQETVLSVVRSLPRFQYDSRKGSFKNWLMRLTGWRIADEVRRRDRGMEPGSPELPLPPDTSTIERVADPAGLKLEAVWNEEWELHLMATALERTKRTVDPKHYQVFDLYVLKAWPATRIARTLKINPGKVYLIKHRINRLIRKEIARLQQKPI